MATPHYPSAGVRRVLRTLGADIRDARKRRGLPMSVVAERAFTSRPTLQRVEEGDPSVGMGIYAMVLQALGVLEGLTEVASFSNDVVAQRLSTEDLPQRVHLSSRRSPE